MHSGGHGDSKEVSLTLGNIIVSRGAVLYESWKVEKFKTKEMFIDLLLIKPNETPKDMPPSAGTHPRAHDVSYNLSL